MLLATATLAWCFILSVGFLVWTGASLTDGWVLAFGLMFAAAAGIVWMAREYLEAIEETELLGQEEMAHAGVRTSALPRRMPRHLRGFVSLGWSGRRSQTAVGRRSARRRRAALPM